MRRVERTRLLIRLVERLAPEEWPTIDLILGQFERRRTDDWQGSKTSYVIWSLEDANDETLLEVAEFFGLAAPNPRDDHHEIGIVEVSTIKRLWGDAPCFRLFLSHISSFSSEAAELKAALERFGISAFVAHADIQPTKEWLEEILRALETMDALATLLVPGFHESKWTDQEVGLAMGRRVPIVSLRFGLDPYGFIGRYQALGCTGQSPDEQALSVARVLIENEETQGTMAEMIAKRMARTGTYADVKTLMDLLDLAPSLPQATLELIEQARQENDQVRDAWGVPEKISELLTKNGYSNVKTKTVDEIPF